MVFFVLSAQFFLDNSHFFFHTHVVCRNFYRLRQAWQGWTRWYFIPLVIQNHEFFVTSSCLFLLFMSVQSSTVSVACRSAGDTSERFRGCLSGYSKETCRHWGKCLSSTVLRYCVISDASFDCGGSYRLPEYTHLGNLEIVSVFPADRHATETVEALPGHKN